MGTLSGKGNANGETDAIFPEIPANGGRAHEDLRVRQLVGRGDFVANNCCQGSVPTVCPLSEHS